MTEMMMSWEDFLVFVKDRPGLDIFESKDAVVTQMQGLTIRAFKPEKWKGKNVNGYKILENSIPFEGLGYSGIAHYDFGGRYREAKIEEKKPE